MITRVTRTLPTGTVTFLFTDVEGSTKLLHALGAEAYAEALATHRHILRDAFTAHGGVEVDTQGDAFFVAFPTAPGALATAQQARDELATGPIKVRMGLHTGTPHLTDEGYVGPDVHRAARIAAAGHAVRSWSRRPPLRWWTRRSPISGSTGSRTSPRPNASTSSATATFRR